MKLPKIVMVIPCWERVEVFSLVCKQLDIFAEKTKEIIDFRVVYVFSENDPELFELKYAYLTSNHQRHHIFSDNELLGQKLNDGITYAQVYEYDYLMNFGSDDLIHESIIDLYMPFINARTAIFGINKLYFLQKNEDPLFFSSYNVPYVIGAGRMIHRSVVQYVIFKHGALYLPEINRGMDTMSAKRMEECGYKQRVIDPGEFPMIVDIKSEININSFESISTHKSRVKTCDISILENEFELLKTYK